MRRIPFANGVVWFVVLAAWMTAVLGTGGCMAAGGEAYGAKFAPGEEKAWQFVSGTWSMGEGVLEQKRLTGQPVALLADPAFADFVLSVECNICPAGSGVCAAAVAFRATGTLSSYWLHLDSKNRQVILVRSTPANTWIEIARRRCELLAPDAWHTVGVRCAGTKIAVSIDGIETLSAEDAAISAGRIGLGASEGNVLFRNLTITGAEVKTDQPLQSESRVGTKERPFRVISRGTAAGTYQAFPDACRLKNGDILAVFYAGYAHVSKPNDAWPNGGRICFCRSRDEGRTWSAPEILYDDADDNRDPHIAQMSDGTLICTFFSLRWTEAGETKAAGVQLVRSADDGQTWEKTAQLVAPDWYESAPVREMPDGTYILGVYCEGAKDGAYGGVVRSTDKGKSWSAPIPIGKGSGLYLDAETDVTRLQDGTLYAALRSSKQNMHYATSPDGGLTWAPVQDIGFKAHCPHLNRLSSGAILLSVRLPSTSLYLSRDECKTWQGPYLIDTVGGAYPATVELKDGTVMAIYYEEGEESAVRVLRFRLTPEGIELLELGDTMPGDHR